MVVMDKAETIEMDAEETGYKTHSTKHVHIVSEIIKKDRSYQELRYNDCLREVVHTNLTNNNRTSFGNQLGFLSLDKIHGITRHHVPNSTKSMEDSGKAPTKRGRRSFWSLCFVVIVLVIVLVICCSIWLSVRMVVRGSAWSTVAASGGG